jgi:hypothetical protein
MNVFSCHIEKFPPNPAMFFLNRSGGMDVCNLILDFGWYRIMADVFPVNTIDRTCA